MLELIDIEKTNPNNFNQYSITSVNKLIYVGKIIFKNIKYK